MLRKSHVNLDLYLVVGCMLRRANIGVKTSVKVSGFLIQVINVAVKAPKRL